MSTDELRKHADAMKKYILTEGEKIKVRLNKDNDISKDQLHPKVDLGCSGCGETPCICDKVNLKAESENLDAKQEIIAALKELGGRVNNELPASRQRYIVQKSIFDAVDILEHGKISKDAKEEPALAKYESKEEICPKCGKEICECGGSNMVTEKDPI